MLAKGPAERPPSAADVARQLIVRPETATRDKHLAMPLSPVGARSDPVATEQLDARSVKQDTAVLDPADAEPTVVRGSRREPRWYERRRVAGALLGFVVLAAVLMSLATWMNPGTARVPMSRASASSKPRQFWKSRDSGPRSFSSATQPCPPAS